MLGVEPEIGTSALRLWVAASSAALLAVFSVLTFVLPWTRMAAAARAAFIVLAAGLGAAMTWALSAVDDPNVERHALQMRAEALTAPAFAPPSPLACLDGLVADSVATACERELFASPATVAATISYTAARLALLADMVSSGERSGRNFDELALPLRRSLEADRFGFLAHVLATRDGCTSEHCKPLALLHDASRIRANLSDGTLDRYLDRYAAAWAKSSEGGLAEAAAAQPSAAPQPPQAPHMVNIDFPTAASIPPVSIMNPEPKGPVLPGVAAAAAANPNPPTSAASSPRHSRKQAANPPSAPAQQARAQAASSASASAASPSAASPSAAVEPIWPEPVPPPPPPATPKQP